MSKHENTVKGPELVLSHVQRAHAGDYICRADNGVGRGAARETVSLDILREYLHTINYLVPFFCEYLLNSCPMVRILWSPHFVP